MLLLHNKVGKKKYILWFIFSSLTVVYSLCHFQIITGVGMFWGFWTIPICLLLHRVTLYVRIIPHVFLHGCMLSLSSLGFYGKVFFTFLNLKYPSETARFRLVETWNLISYSYTFSYRSLMCVHICKTKRNQVSVDDQLFQSVDYFVKFCQCTKRQSIASDCVVQDCLCSFFNSI